MKIIELTLFFTLNTIVFGLMDLERTYCTLIPNSFGVLSMTTSQNLITVSPTQITQKTQSYPGNDYTTVNLAYNTDGGDLIVEETTSDLEIFTHTETEENTLFYVDSRDNYVLTRKYVTSSSSEYVFYKLTSGKSEVMKQIDFDNSNEKNGGLIVGMNFSKIVGIDESFYMYIVLTTSTSTALYSISLMTFGIMSKVADIDPTTRLEIVAGNSYYMYDSQCELFYVFNEGTFVAKSAQDLGHPEMSTPLKFIELSEMVFFAYSNVGNDTYILEFDKGNEISNKSIHLIGVLKTWTDNFRNAIFATENDLIWYNINEGTLTSIQLSASSTNQTQIEKILNMIHSAVSVSFDGSLAISIFSSNLKSTDSIGSIRYNSYNDKITIEDDYEGIYDGQNYPDSPTTSGMFNNNFTCQCVSDSLYKLECYDTEMKCIMLTVPSTQDCTVSQNQNLS